MNNLGILLGRQGELTRQKKSGYLDTLAAAYAATGRFPEAITTVEKALELTLSSENNELAEEIEGRLGLYRANQPYIEQSD